MNRRSRTLVFVDDDAPVIAAPEPAPEHKLDPASGWPSATALDFQAKALVAHGAYEMESTEYIGDAVIKTTFSASVVEDLASQHGVDVLKAKKMAEAVAAKLVKDMAAQHGINAQVEFHGKKPDIAAMAGDLFQLKKMIATMHKQLEIPLSEDLQKALDTPADKVPAPSKKIDPYPSVPVLVNKDTLKDLKAWDAMSSNDIVAGSITKQMLADALGLMKKQAGG